MKLLCLFLILPFVSAQAGFGRSYLRNSRLCRQWSCINKKLGLPDSLPARSLAEETFRNILPQGAWQDVVGPALDNCYGNRSRQYTNTCPGQALLHCFVDQLIDKCPHESTNKADACSPVSSLAGLKHMFSQSRYYNLEENLPREHRPTWFLKNYFDQKCCDLPVMFNATVLLECGFTSFMTYYTHEPKPDTKVSTPVPSTPRSEVTVNIVNLSSVQDSAVDTMTTDPLDCCDMKDFIQPYWRAVCDFQLTWRGHERLVIANNTHSTEAPITTTTIRADTPKDLMLLPQSCEKENCVFRKLGIIKETGAINTLAFMKLLENFTNAHPTWKKASARVVTKCLSRKIRDYDGECEINKVLACTLDLLTENCPLKRKFDDSCRRNKRKSGCQISSSKMRPKNRREVCLLPQLVPQSYLSECDLDSLYKVEHITVNEPKPRKFGWAASQYMCQDQTSSTTCIMNRMGVLNKYKFMDYFKMKDRIRQFTSNQVEWAALLDIYMSAFVNIPLYGDHCSSQKKLLNVVDAMLMTCPVTKRVDTPQCRKLFKEMTETTPVDHQNVTRQKFDQILSHYHHIFLPNQPVTTKFDRVIHKQVQNVKKPVFNYGLLDTGDAPEVKVLNIKPVVITRLDRPLVLAPVYLRDPKLNLARPFTNDPAFRSNPYWLHDKIASAHLVTPASTNLPPFSTFSPENPVTEPLDSRFRMVKPE